MKRIGNIQKVFLALLLFSSPLMAADGPVTFKAIVDRNQYTVEETINLSLVLSGDVPSEEVHPTLPDFAGFEVMGSSVGSSSSSVYQNGSFQFLKTLIYHYSLLPQQAGNLEIGPATIEVRGKTLSTAPIKLKILPAGANPTTPQARNSRNRAMPQQRPQQQQQDDDDINMPHGFPGFDDDDDVFTQLLKRRGFILNPGGGIKSAPQGEKNAFFITVEANKKRAYVGEQIVATWSLYTRGQIQAFDALKYPDLKGFWKEDLEIAQRLNFQQEVVNGVPYQKAVLVSYALFPISAGKKTIDPLKAKATVIDTAATGMGVFGFGRPYTYVKSSQELPIDVVALPTEGRPASFSGAVGKFNITGSLSTAVAKVNQPFSLKIKFQGKGNVKAIELPALNFPSNLEVYDTKKESQFNKSGEGFIEFEILIIPRNVGEGVIPPISLSFFDPQTSKYTTQNTPEFKIKVVAGDGSSGGGVSAPMAGSGAAAAPVVVKDLHYLKTYSLWTLPKKIAPLFWILAFLIPLAWFGLAVKKLRTGGVEGKDALKKRAKAKLKTARVKLNAGDWKSAGVEITNAVLSILGEVSGTGGASQTAEEMLRRMGNVDPKLHEKVMTVLSHCELMSFAPEEMMAKDIKKDKKILSEAETVIEDLLATKLRG